MRDFFNSWRRMAGCVALLVAIATMGLWVRSRFWEDSVRLWPTSNVNINVKTGMAAIDLEHLWVTQSDNPPTRKLSWWATTPNGRDTKALKTLPNFDSGIWGAPYSDGGFARGRYWVVTIPYLTSVILLAALSAFLILWKPRRHVCREAKI